MFRDLYLSEDEVQVRANITYAFAWRGYLLRHWVQRCRRSIGNIDDGLGRRREDLLQDSATVLIDRLHAQRQSGEIGRHPEDGAVRALEREIAGWRRDNVLKDAGAGVALDLPDVGDGLGYRPGRIGQALIVGVSHA